MNKLVLTPAFKRAFKRCCRHRKEFSAQVGHVLNQLEVDHTHPILHTHKLSGNLDGVWACSAAYDLRILFRISRDEVSKQVKIVLLDIGTHDEVY